MTHSIAAVFLIHRIAAIWEYDVYNMMHYLFRLGYLQTWQFLFFRIQLVLLHRFAIFLISNANSCYVFINYS